MSPETEVQKMEDEFYHLTVKGNDLKTYVRRFQELATLCPTMVLDSKKMMEVFIGGLPRISEHILWIRKSLNMRQCRWLELLADYDGEIRYHPGKANVVADALIRKERIKPLKVRSYYDHTHQNYPYKFSKLKLKHSNKKTSRLKTYEEWTNNLKYVLMETRLSRIDVG
ncbi:putative reverse transcriptase domain-containing protein [Tanacetum coccineum]